MYVCNYCVLIVISVGCCMHLEWWQTGLLDMGSRRRSGRHGDRQTNFCSL